MLIDDNISFAYKQRCKKNPFFKIMHLFIYNYLLMLYDYCYKNLFSLLGPVSLAIHPGVLSCLSAIHHSMLLAMRRITANVYQTLAQSTELV